ncbi:MAG: hypothetical protein ABI833_08230, partial [Acidobacteriota bacterium]
MTRRYALLLSLSAPIAAQVCGSDQAPEGQLQSQPGFTGAGPHDLRWNPCPVFIGAPVLFKSKSFSGPATWLGKNIDFRPDGNAFSALAGVNLNRAPGRYPLLFGRETVEVTVTGHNYPSSTITVPQKFVDPPKEIEAQIEQEVAIKQRVFSSSAPERLWQGPFLAPANTRFTSSFGARRI